MKLIVDLLHHGETMQKDLRPSNTRDPSIKSKTLN